MIVGADSTTDADVLRTSATLYGTYKLKRVYYSAFSPIPDSSAILPLKPPPMQRENRLYQADWLLRYYGFGVDEIAAGDADGMLDLDIDPKLAWALKNRHLFPVDVNTRRSRDAAARAGPWRKGGRPHHFGATAHDLALRGCGTSHHRRSNARRAFLVAADHRPGATLDAANLRQRLVEAPRQLSLFG